MSWRDLAVERIHSIEAQGRWRRIRSIDASGPIVRLEGIDKDVISFASNDYLGLSSDPRVVEAARAATERWGTGAGSARLIAGSRPVHDELESELADWKSKERALLFPTGYSANLAVLGTLGRNADLICSDQMNHASIIDGCRLARTRTFVYPHKDMDALDAALSGAERAIVVSDTVFSMDGNVAPVEALTEVSARHGALLVIDEAHAVLGPHPERTDVDRLRVGTLSKFLGASGGFVAADGPFVDLLVNEARPFIFTTATPPADAAAALTALRILRSAEGEALVRRLRTVVDRIAPDHPSPIVPVIVGDANDAVAVSEKLLARGLLVPAIRPPSVPQGTSRLRITLSAAHTDDHTDLLLRALRDEGLAPADA